MVLEFKTEDSIDALFLIVKRRVNYWNRKFEGTPPTDSRHGESYLHSFLALQDAPYEIKIVADWFDEDTGQSEPCAEDLIRIAITPLSRANVVRISFRQAAMLIVENGGVTISSDPREILASQHNSAEPPILFYPRVINEIALDLGWHLLADLKGREFADQWLDELPQKSKSMVNEAVKRQHLYRSILGDKPIYQSKQQEMDLSIVKRKTNLPIPAEDFVKQLEHLCYKSARGGGAILAGAPPKEMELRPVSDFELEQSPVFIDGWPIELPTDTRKYYTARLTVSINHLKSGDVLQFDGSKPIILDRKTDSSEPIHLTRPVIWFEILPVNGQTKVTGKYSALTVNGKPLIAELFNRLWGELVALLKPVVQTESPTPVGGSRQKSRHNLLKKEEIARGVLHAYYIQLKEQTGKTIRNEARAEMVYTDRRLEEYAYLADQPTFRTLEGHWKEYYVRHKAIVDKIIIGLDRR